MPTTKLAVEVAYATPAEQYLFVVRVPQGSTALEAVHLSDLFERVPSLKDEKLKVGVFSQQLKDPQAYEVKTGDRLEIYRPLLIDPKQARRQRAAK